MAEEEKTELPEITEEKIEKAALPENKRVDEDISEEVTFVELDEADVKELGPVTDEEVKEDFEPHEVVEERVKDSSEVEKRAALAQNRIDQAVKQSKEYARRELQALQYAKELETQNKELRKSQEQISENYGTEFESRIDAQTSAAKQALKEATEQQDAEAMADAQSLMATAAADRTRLEQYKQQLEAYQSQQKLMAEQQELMQSQPPPATDSTQYGEPSQKAHGWAQKNTWFGVDPILTNVAFGVHSQLESEGFDTESDEYYSEIDKRIRHEMPHKFTDENVQSDSKPVQTVASATRANGRGRNQGNRIELSPSEQQLAKKLGVPLKEYAKHKVRLQRS